MARFTHPAISARGGTETGEWNLIGGTKDESGNIIADDQPQFNGDPLFTGRYIVIGELCEFTIDVDMDNITDFGSGQYYMVLPFQVQDNMLFNGGCLHDVSSGNQYSILGHVVAGSDQLMLFSIASNGRHVPFEHSVPVTLSTADNFHLTGTFEIFTG